jgi:hypothetical protein
VRAVRRFVGYEFARVTSFVGATGSSHGVGVREDRPEFAPCLHSCKVGWFNKAVNDGRTHSARSGPCRPGTMGRFGDERPAINPLVSCKSVGQPRGIEKYWNDSLVLTQGLVPLGSNCVRCSRVPAPKDHEYVTPRDSRCDCRSPLIAWAEAFSVAKD